MFTLGTGQTLHGVAGSATAITYTLTGDEKATADSFKVLAQGQLPSSIATLYTAPALTATLVQRIFLQNTTAGAVSVTLAINGTAAANRIATFTIGANGFATFTGDGWKIYDSMGAATISSAPITATGDATGTQTGTSLPLVLATVNANTGSWGTASSVPQFTINAKGLMTAAANVAIAIPESAVTNLVTDLAGKQPTGNYITALTADGTAAGPGSAALTLATVNANTGAFGSATAVATFTVNGKGLTTAAGATNIQIPESQVTNLVTDLAGKQPTGNYITALTSDVTAAGPGSAAATLATVNANVGAFGSASSVGTFTVNAKGLTTAAASTAIAITESQVTNLVTDLAGKQPTGNYLTAITGDLAAAGPGSSAGTLATVNSNVGAFGSASSVGTFTVNAKGLTTAAASTPILITEAQVTNLVTDLAAKAVAALLINTTLPLTGGGDLTANRTLGINAASTTAAGSMSLIDKKKMNTWTDLVNELGADPTGVTDATAIITAWLASVTSATLFLPPNCRVRVDGPVAWNKECNFIGGERRTSILSSGHATNNMFNVSSDGVLFEGLRFSAGAAGTDNSALRTAGFALSMDNTSDSSGIRKCDILFQWSGVQSSGSLQFMEDLNIREYGVNAANGQCILIDGVGDRYIRRITTDNGINATGFAGVRVKTCASLVISDCNIIHATNALELSPGAGQTVPSVEAVNCFFDTSVNGLAVVPTSTGVVARSKFTNCWFGTHTTNGILLSNPGGATSSFNGLQFINCDIYGNPTGINASAGGGKWEFTGGAIAGSTTQAILLGPSAEHFPKISDNVIGPHGLFGANALGIVVTVGTYKGLVISDNDVVNNTGAALTLGAVTVAAGEAGWFRIIDNAGINPRGAVTIPGVPVAGATVTNTTGFRVLIFYKNGGVAPASVVINGVSMTVTRVASAVESATLEPGGTIAFTTTTVAAWSWAGH